ncbi:MAG: RNA polymerase factor sigma-54 [Bacteroidales bacterium]|jgi:RNA polymerase sigma-54 factor|nr:RNA polymerase factor sigma-54 [Bacteroidales bacterium]
MLRQSLHIKQLQKLSPQQVQLMKLLQVPTLELEQRIKQELEENPALEEVNKESDSESQEESSENTENSNDSDDFDIRDYLDEDDVADYKLRSNNHPAADSHRDIPISESLGFIDHLLSQLRLLSNSETEFTIGEIIIGNIDESGYLQRELSAIVDDLAFSQNIFTDLPTVETVLKKIQTLDPAGVGARNLQECLLLQLQRKNVGTDVGTGVKPVSTVAYQILERMFDAFTNKRYDQILQRLNISEEQLSSAIQEITKLNPKPGSAYSDSVKIGSQTIVPDFIVTPENDHFEIILNVRNAPELRVSRDYADLLQTYSESKQKTKVQKEAVTFVRQKIDSAKSFIEAIKLRQHTLLGTMEAIVNLQPDYFKDGDITMLKPMKMQDVADLVGLDVSTISRVVNSKYVQTPFGIFLLRDLFSNAISNEEGEDVTSAEIKVQIAEIIANEDKRKPLNDDALTAILAEKGYTLARRTVAKYREGLGIGVARLRKSI